MGVKLFKIVPEVFAGWKTGLKFLIKEGFPDDAKIMWAGIDADVFVLEVWSRSWPVICSDADKYFVPIFERIDDAKEKTDVK